MTDGADRGGDHADRGDDADTPDADTPDEGDDDALVGRSVPRVEDRALLTGRATFVDDADEPRLAHLAFVRSERGHARLADVDLSPATDREDVLAAFTWNDVAATDAPGEVDPLAGPLDADPPGHPLLARDRVRYQGQPIAAVVATDRYAAADAARAVAVEYEPLDAVVDPAAARADDAPTLFDGIPDNVATTTDLGDEAAVEEAFDAADDVVSVDLENNRLVPSPVEPRVAMAEWDDGEERLTVTMAVQNPHGQRGNLADALGLRERDVRVVSPHVGGGFGQKNTAYPDDAMVGWVAMELGRPVKWTATRREDYLAGNHGRDHRTRAELAVDDDGTIRGLRVDTDAAVGAYSLGGGAALAAHYGSLLAGQYDVPAIHCRTRAVFTNTAPVHTYRGGTRPMALYVTERVVDAAARELGMDPVELRRRNLIPPDEFPHETAVGATYDSGDYEASLAEALDPVDYGDLRAAERDDDGRYVGVGVAAFVESSTGSLFECGVVRVHPDGSVEVAAGTHSHGQGHATTYAQVVADVLGVPFETVSVVEGDTDRVPKGTGTFGSRSTVAGGNAVRESAREVAATVREIAADRLDADPGDVTLTDGECRAGGDACAFAEVASTAYGRGRPDGLDPGLEATTFYEPDGDTVAFGTHLAVVAVDPETGAVEVERYVAADDCGERVNPAIVEGQVVGSVVQGIGQARFERTVYDEDGHLVTDTMRSYGVPQATQVPDVETRATVTPSPNNALGAKGVGEAGTIAAPPAVVNAVVDALEPLGVRHLDMPLTDDRVWRAIRAAQE